MPLVTCRATLGGVASSRCVTSSAADSVCQTASADLADSNLGEIDQGMENDRAIAKASLRDRVNDKAHRSAKPRETFPLPQAVIA